jgi:phospholipase/carboxylesterase
MNRRKFLISSSAALLAGCIDTSAPTIEGAERLSARPGHRSAKGETGQFPLELSDQRDGFFYVPANYALSNPASLVVLLHGAGHSASDWSSPSLMSLFDERNIIAVVPDSRDLTWDLSLGGFGPDVRFIDRALAKVFSLYEVKSTSIALAGFSDGASYALSLGASNGDLFNALMAFSPGFFQPRELRGKPKVFISHGTEDTVLPFGNTQSKIIPAFTDKGYNVKFLPFEGGHTVTLSIFTQAVDWWLGGIPELRTA